LSKKKVVIFFIFLLFIFAEGAALSARGICSSRGGGHVNVHYGNYGRGGNMDDLMMLFMLSSTSTTIYCISFDDDSIWYDSKNRRRSQYSQLNYDQLKEDGARGKGEHLAVLSRFLGCPASSQQHFSSLVQKNYRNLFAAEKKSHSNKELILRLEVMIQKDATLNETCSEKFESP